MLAYTGSLNQGHYVRVGETLCAAFDANLTISSDFTIILSCPFETAAATDQGVFSAYAGTTPIFQVTVKNNSGAANMRVRFSQAGVFDLVNGVINADAEWNEYGDRRLLVIQREGSSCRAMVLDSVQGRWDTTTVRAGNSKLREVTQMFIGGQAGVSGSSDRQPARGTDTEFRALPFMVYSSAIDFDDIEAAFNAADIGGVLTGPSNGWFSSILMGIGHSGDPGGSGQADRFIVGAEVDDGAARISAYAKGVISYNTLNEFVAPTSGEIEIVATSDREIRCHDIWLDGWRGSGAAISSDIGADLSGASPVIYRSVNDEAAGNEVVAIYANSRTARVPADNSLSIPWNTTGETYPSAVSPGHVVTGVSGNWTAGLAATLGQACVGSFRAPANRGVDSAWPCMAIKQTAINQADTSSVLPGDDSYAAAVTRMCFHSSTNAAGGVGGFLAIEAGGWADFVMAPQLGINPGDPRKVRLAFLKAPWMNDQVEIRIVGLRSAASTTEAVRTELSAVVETINCQTTAQGVTTVDSVGIDTEITVADAPSSIVRGNCIVARTAGEPLTGFVLIHNVADAVISTEFKMGGATNTIAAGDDVAFGAWNIVHVEVEIPETLFGDKGGGLDIPNNIVGVEVLAAGSTYPVYVLGELHRADKPGVVVGPVGKSGASSLAFNLARSVIPNPDTGKDALESCFDAIGVSGLILMGADQSADEGANATNVANAVADLMDQFAALKPVVVTDPIQGTSGGGEGGWTTVNDRADFWEKVKAHAETRNLAFVDLYDRNGGLGNLAAQWCLGARVDVSHHSARGAYLAFQVAVAALASVVTAGGSSNTAARSASSLRVGVGI
jgi:hypothetical protein